MMTLHPADGEAERCIILTITVRLGDERALAHCVVAAAFCSAGLLISSAVLVSCLPVHRPSDPVTVTVTRDFQVKFKKNNKRGKGEKKRRRNLVFFGRIHLRINGKTKTIYNDSRFKAIFDHIDCAQSPFLLFFFFQPAETQLFPSVSKLLLKERNVNIYSSWREESRKEGRKKTLRRHENSRWTVMANRRAA